MATRKVQMNVMVLPETKERIEQMAQKAFRGLGDQVDWLVDKAWAESQGLPTADVDPCEKPEAQQ